MNLKSVIAACEASVVLMAAMNQTQTLMNQKVFNQDAQPYDEDRVARKFGAEALDHFRAIRRHRDALRKIITTHNGEVNQ